jgi:3-deoxy-D-manno-octulosonic acid kinase
MYLRSGLTYSASIIVERLYDVSPFGAIIDELSENLWFEIGRTIRRFHDANVFHADLNCFNVLVSEGSIFLIDFDKGRLVVESSPDASWKLDNLARLKRSVAKLAQGEVVRRWPILLQGYESK